MHPADRARAVALGADAIMVSNHGGRQTDAAPAVVDVLPRLADAVGGRAQVLVDGGIRSALDVAKLVALGADAAFSGRGFLTALGALGNSGAEVFASTLIEGVSTAMAQHGAQTVEQTRQWDLRHPTVWSPPSGSDRVEGA